MVWGSRQQRKKASWGQNLHENSYLQNSTRSKQMYKAKAETMSINLVVENVNGVGVKTTKKEGKLGAKFA